MNIIWNRRVFSGSIAGLILLAACGSEAPVAAPVTVTVPTTVTATVTAGPTVSQATVDLCAEVRNELAASGIADAMDQALASESVPVIAFATPVDTYRTVSPGSAEPEIADAVIALNKSIGVLQGEIFTLWTDDQTAALAAAYGDVTAACAQLG